MSDYPMLNEVQGQDEGVRYLRRVVTGDLKFALLLLGEEGTGRRFSITQAVKEVFAASDPNGNKCYQVDRGVHPDYITVSPQDGKDIGIDAVRDILGKVYDFPMVAKKRFIVFDGADRMTPAAANAFLKTLEEPPKTTQFFLLAESAEEVLPTIRSRCGNVRYKRLSESLIVEHLKGLTEDPLKALVCARIAEGSLGRAVQYLGSNRLDLRDRVFSLLKLGLGKDLSSLFLAVDEFKTELPLGVRFLDILLYDLTMLPFNASQITNLDLAEELGRVRGQIGGERLRALQVGLKQVQDREASTKINLGFHVKTCLATCFSE